MLCPSLCLPEALFGDRIKSSSSGSVATSLEEDLFALSKQGIVRYAMREQRQRISGKGRLMSHLDLLDQMLGSRVLPRKVLFKAHRISDCAALLMRHLSPFHVYLWIERN